MYHHLEELLVFGLLIFGVLSLGMIAFVLYQKNYASESKKKISFTKMYFTFVFFGLSFVLLLVVGKFGNNLIDKKFESQFDVIDEQMDKTHFDVDSRHCAYILGLSNQGSEEPKLTTKQFEECKIKEKERKKLYNQRQELWRIKRKYKDMYFFAFIGFLWVIHGIGYFVRKNK